MSSLSLTAKNTVTTTSGGTVTVQPGGTTGKSIANITEVFDRTFTLAASTSATIYNSGADGNPATWESCQIVVETADKEAWLRINDGTTVFVVRMNDKFPFNFHQMNTGATGNWGSADKTPNKVVTLDVNNVQSDTSIVVRIVCFGPEVT